jgi:hypothetical protein
MRARPRSILSPRSPLASLVAALLMLATVGASSAAASASIEGVWAFSGGQIAVESNGDGTYTGTVVAATTFAECVHPEGQKIWTNITQQPDGSYFGEHLWYFEDSGCVENPERGPTAWRVLEESGVPRLEVCFSQPGTSQPTIAASGSSAGVTYGCFTSELTAPAPIPGGTSPAASTPSSGEAAFIQSLLHPGAKKCVSARRFTIHLAEPQYDPFKTVRVTLKHKTIATRHRGNYVDATIDLKGRRRGAFTINISATTVLGLRLSGSRTYHTCAKKPKRHKPAKLKAKR